MNTEVNQHLKNALKAKKTTRITTTVKNGENRKE